MSEQGLRPHSPSAKLKRFVVVSKMGEKSHEFIAGSYDTLAEAVLRFRERTVDYRESPIIVDAKQLDAKMVGRRSVRVGSEVFGKDSAD